MRRYFDTIHYIVPSIIVMMVLGCGVLWYNAPQQVRLTTELHQPDQVSIPEAGLVISSDADLGETQITVTKKATEINKQPTIKRVVDIQPEKDENLDAELVFKYKERELNGLDESRLILYSSEDDGETWIAHHDSKVDPATNSIHLDGIEHFSLWTAAMMPPDPGGVLNPTAWFVAEDIANGGAGA